MSLQASAPCGSGHGRDRREPSVWRFGKSEAQALRGHGRSHKRIDGRSHKRIDGRSHKSMLHRRNRRAALATQYCVPYSNVTLRHTVFRMGTSDEQAHDKLRLELRRGVLTIATMAALRTEHYGYSLRKALLAAGLDIDEGTLYPLVRRLEEQGLLVSEWRETEGRARRYYRFSPIGARALDEFKAEWAELNRALEILLEQKS